MSKQKHYVHELIPENILFSNQQDALRHAIDLLGWPQSVPIRIIKSKNLALIRHADTDLLLRTVLRREVNRLEK